jgi:branched-chain amino acid transport system substrate-binding protein
MNKRLALLVIATLAVATIVLVAACGNSGGTSSGSSGSSSGEKVITIGFSAAMSGPYAAYDTPQMHGMQLAEHLINTSGGIDGWKVKVDIVDNKGDQSLSATTVQGLLDKGIRVLIVTASDSMSAQAQLISQSGGVACLGSLSSPTVAIDAGDRAFMVSFGDNTMAAASAEYSLKQGYKNAYVLGSSELPYTSLTPGWFKQVFEAGGGKVVGTDTYKIGATDYATQVTKIQNCSPQPDVIYSPIFVPDSGVFLKQLRAAGVTTPFVSHDGNDSVLYGQSGGNAVDGSVYTTHTFLSEPGMPADFLKAYKAFFHKDPETNATEAMGRDTIYIITQAAANANSSDPDKVLAAIRQLKDYQVVTGSYTAAQPPNVVPDLPVWMIKMKGTEPTLLDTFKPTNIPSPTSK